MEEGDNLMPPTTPGKRQHEDDDHSLPALRGAYVSAWVYVELPEDLDPNEVTDEQFIKWAYQRYHDEGVIEIDAEFAEVSRSIE